MGIRKINIIIAFIVGILLISLSSAANNRTVVQGTHFAMLNNAYEVLKKIPGVTFDKDNNAVVNGVNVATIFLNKQRINDPKQLHDIPANSIKSIMVIANPDTEYSGDYQAVIIIESVKAPQTGYQIYDQLQLSYNKHMGVYNYLSVNVARNKLTLNGALSYNYTNTDYKIEEFYETVSSAAPNAPKILETREYYQIYRYLKTREVTTKVAAEYQFSNNHKIAVRYEYYTRGKYRKENNPEIVNFYQRGGKPQIDLQNPVYTTSEYGLDNRPIDRHSIHIGYSGKVKGWEINSQADFFHNFEGQYATSNPTGNPNTITKDLLFEQAQQYYNIKGLAKHKLGNGDILFGGEVNFIRHVNLYDNFVVDKDRTHARINDNTQGLFINVTQHFKWFDLKAGIRYDHRRNSYTPYKDDESRQELIDTLSLYNVGNSLNHNYFTTNIELSKKIGSVKTSLSYDISYIKPFKKFQRISSDELDNLSSMLLRTEFQHSLSLFAEWKMLKFIVYYTHYKNPIFETMSSLENYNGPDYNSLGLHAIARYKFGIWEPNLSLYLHKQWLRMETVDGKNNLCKPRLITMFSNSFDLPLGLTFDIIANWETKGAKRSVMNYTHYFNVDASVHKEFLNGKLCVMLTGENILNTACEDATRYTLLSDGTCGGDKTYLPYHITLSLKLRL